MPSRNSQLQFIGPWSRLCIWFDWRDRSCRMDPPTWFAMRSFRICGQQRPCVLERLVLHPSISTQSFMTWGTGIVAWRRRCSVLRTSSRGGELERSLRITSEPKDQTPRIETLHMAGISAAALLGNGPVANWAHCVWISHGRHLRMI